MVGPGPTLPHLRNALGFAAGGVGVVEGPYLDLGSGAGLPGLVLALAFPRFRWTLVDAGQRRAEHLARAVERLGVGDRVTVVVGRAEELAREAAFRGAFGLVTARGFGPPAVTAECAAGFLRVGGRLVVSEPPELQPDRWPARELSALGMEPYRLVRGEQSGYQVLEQREPCPDHYPRRTGVPAKRPLFAGD